MKISSSQMDKMQLFVRSFEEEGGGRYAEKIVQISYNQNVSEKSNENENNGMNGMRDD